MSQSIFTVPSSRTRVEVSLDDAYSKNLRIMLALTDSEQKKLASNLDKYLSGAMKEAFDTEGASTGSPWAELKKTDPPSVIARRVRANQYYKRTGIKPWSSKEDGYYSYYQKKLRWFTGRVKRSRKFRMSGTEFKTLQREGSLKRSLISTRSPNHIAFYRDLVFTFGTNVRHAEWMARGEYGPGPSVARPILKFTAVQRAEVQLIIYEAFRARKNKFASKETMRAFQQAGK